MAFKLSLGVISYPGCGGVILYHDLGSTGLYLGKCVVCKKQWELRSGPRKDSFEIKPKRIN